jgi:hypothetical protein
MTKLRLADVLYYSIIEASAEDVTVAPPIYDSPPVWNSENPAFGTLVASPDGATAVLTPAIGAAPGLETTVTVAFSAKGVALKLEDDVILVSGAVTKAKLIGRAGLKGAPADDGTGHPGLVRSK